VKKVVYEGKVRYQDASVAESYDSRRFSSVKGTLTDFCEKRAIVQLLQKANVANGRVLDIPCGTGRITEQLVNYDFNVVAADISEEMMKHAKRRLEHLSGSVQFEVADIENMQFPKDCFDVVVTIRLFHHLPPEMHLHVLNEIRRVTKKWAIVTFSTKYAVQNWRRNIVSYVTKFPRYSISFSRFRETTKQAGFDIVGYKRLLPGISETITVLLREHV